MNIIGKWGFKLIQQRFRDKTKLGEANINIVKDLQNAFKSCITLLFSSSISHTYHIFFLLR